jgi:hypothetical protein
MKYCRRAERITSTCSLAIRPGDSEHEIADGIEHMNNECFVKEGLVARESEESYHHGKHRPSAATLTDIHTYRVSAATMLHRPA